TKDDHWPARPLLEATRPRAVLNAPDFAACVVERGGHLLMHLDRVVAVDEARHPAIAEQELFQLVARNASEDRRTRDLVPVEMEDREHRPIVRWVQELVRVPARGKRPGLGLAVADDATHEKSRVVERGAERVAQRITEFSSFVNAAGCLGR